MTKPVPILLFIGVTAFLFGCIGLDSSLTVWDKDGLYFEYPKDLTVSVDSNSDANIIVEIEPITDFVQPCVEMQEWYAEMNEEGINLYMVTQKYRDILVSLREEGLNTALDEFDSTCSHTMGTIASARFEVDGNNAVIYQKAFAQDVGSLTVFYTQLLFVDQYDKVYSLTFDYDFGENKEFLDTIRGEDGEAAYHPMDIDVYPDPPLWSGVFNFFAYDMPIEHEEILGFSENREVIEGIINSVRLTN